MKFEMCWPEDDTQYTGRGQFDVVARTSKGDTVYHLRCDFGGNVYVAYYHVTRFYIEMTVDATMIGSSPHPEFPKHLRLSAIEDDYDDPEYEGDILAMSLLHNILSESVDEPVRVGEKKPDAALLEEETDNE